MKKRVLTALLSLCMCAAVLTGTVFTVNASGNASTGGNWSDEANRDTAWTNGAISTAQQLAQFAYLINHGTYRGENEVWLTTDIDLSGKRWTPIGADENHAYGGLFDGNGYTVKNMQLADFKSSGYEGLFGWTSATIRNVTVTGAATTPGFSNWLYVGAIAGVSEGGTITNCTSRLTMELTLSGVCYIGGLVGINFGKISRCTNEADITVHGEKTNVGGIAAGSDGSKGGASIDRCVNNGAINGIFAHGAGIVAYAFNDPCTITNCINHGTLNTASPTAFLGGIAAYYNGTQFKNCFNTGTVEAERGSALVSYIGDSEAADTIENIYYLKGSATGDEFGKELSGAEMKEEAFVEMLNHGDDAFQAVPGSYPAIAPLAVSLTVITTPASASVTLCASNGGTEILPETDGSYRLLPGDYTITARAEGYQAKTMAHTLTYDRATQKVYLSLSLIPVNEPNDKPTELPATGDNANVPLWCGLTAALSICTLAVLSSRKKEQAV